MQLKDKWRNLIKFQHLRRGEIESAPYKATVRAKQNAAAAAAKGISGKTKATKSGGASGKTAGAGKKRNATADQGGNAAKNKGKTNAAGGRGFKKGTNNNDNNNLMDAFQKGPKGKRSKIARGGRFGGSADGTDSIDNNVSLDHLTNGGEGIGRSISPALPPKKQAFKQQKKKMKLLAEARQKAGTPDAKARALHAPSNAPPRKRVAAAWAAGISDVNQIGSRGLLNSNINSLDEDEQDILGAHLGHVTFDLDGDDNAHHLATTSGRGQNKKGAPSSASMAQFTEEMEREIEQTKERRAQMVRDVEYSETELARLKSLVEEAEKVYSQARQKAQETLQQAQKEIAEKRRKQSMESLEEQKKVAAPKRESDEENKDTKKNDVNKNNDDDDDENNINKSKGAATRKSLEASKQPSATIKDEKVDDDDDEPSNEDVSPKSVPNLNDVEDIEVDDAEWDKYLAFGGDNANDDEDEDMSEMQRAAQIASDEKKRKKYATDSEMNKSPKSPRLRSQAGNNSHRDAATKETTPATTITTALEQNRRQQQQQYQFIPSNPNEHYDTDDWDDDLSSDDEDDEELDEEQLVSKAAWEKAQTALARAGLPPMQEIENVLLQELKRLEQANTKLVHARLALEACDSELSELFARAEARKAGVYNEDDDLREQTTNTGSLPSDLQNIHTDDEEDDDLQVVDNKRKNTHDGDNDEEDDEDDDDDDNDNDNDDDDDDDDDDGKGEEQEEEMKKSTRSGGAKKTVERDNTRKKLRSREPQDGNEKKNERSSPVGKKGGKRWDDGNAQKGEENEEEKTVGKQKVTAGANKNKLANSRNKQQVDQKDSKKKSGGSGQKSGSGGGSGRGGSGFRSVSEDRRFGIYDARRYRSVEENDRDAQMNGGKINFALGGSNTASAANTQNSTGVSNNYESGEKNRRFAKGKGKSGGQQRGRAVSIGRGGGGSANAKASSYKESAMAFAATHWPQELKRRRDNSARKKRVKLGKSLWE